MKRFMAFVSILLLPAVVLALSRAQLTYEAKELVPGSDVTVVKLKTGEEHQGDLIADTAANVVIRVNQNGIERSMTFEKANVESVQPEDISQMFADKLLEIRLDEQRNLTAREYERALKLFDEYILLNPTGPMNAEVKARRKAFAAEFEAFQQGLIKLGGDVLTQTMATMRQYENLVRENKEFVLKYPGIATAGFTGDAEAKKNYDDVVAKRKESVRSLPKMVNQSVALHLSKKDFKSAAEEADAFVKLWLNVVAVEESVAGTSALTGMDPEFINKLQKGIMKAYLDAKRGFRGDLPKNYFLPKDMTYIPGSFFLMGGDKSGPKDSEFPLHLVYVDSYLIDRYEVRNKDYRKFLEYVKRSGDSSMEHPNCPPLKDHTPACVKYPSANGDNQPVTGVDWYDAYAYAKWAGKRLPTEAEWEKAARGLRMIIYPWGNEGAPGSRAVNTTSGRAFLNGLLNTQCPMPPAKKSFMSTLGISEAPPPPSWNLPGVTWDVDQSLPAEVLQKQAEGLFVFTIDKNNQSISPYKVFHMAGNAAEWVNDYYDPQYYRKGPLWNPKGPDAGDDHVYRGGFYGSGDDQVKTYWRGTQQDYYAAAKKGVCTDGFTPMIGFRCVKSLTDIKVPNASSSEL